MTFSMDGMSDPYSKWERRIDRFLWGFIFVGIPVLVIVGSIVLLIVHLVIR